MEIDEDLIRYYKCSECGGRCCKDEFDSIKEICVDCLYEKDKKECQGMSFEEAKIQGEFE